jgi:hypothetical protein
MNKEFKTLLLKIAKLPKQDQQWVLKQLPHTQIQQFEQLQGYALLKQAGQFRTLSYSETKPPSSKDITLPAWCEPLKKQTPLYIAIILEQGQFNWTDTFLNTTEQKNEIHQLITDAVIKIKSATKLALFQHWQSQLDFDEQLESAHG